MVAAKMAPGKHQCISAIHGATTTTIIGAADRAYCSYDKRTQILLTFTVLMLAIVISVVFYDNVRMHCLNSEIAQIKHKLAAMKEDMVLSISGDEEENDVYDADYLYDTDEEEDYYGDYVDDTDDTDDDWLHELTEKVNNNVGAQQDGRRARIRREVINAEESASRDSATDKPKRRRHRNQEKRRKNKRNKAKKAKSSSGVDAVHIIPIEHPQDIVETVMNGNPQKVDCGSLTKRGLQVGCRIATYWQLDPDSRNTTMVRLANGMLLINQPGLYYIYSQMTHHDPLGSWSYGVNRTRDGAETMLVQCPGMEPHFESGTNAHTVYPVQFQCHTSLAVRLKQDDQLSIYNMYFVHENRVLKLDKHLTFWGLIRLGD